MAHFSSSLSSLVSCLQLLVTLLGVVSVNSLSIPRTQIERLAKRPEGPTITSVVLSKDTYRKKSSGRVVENVNSDILDFFRSFRPDLGTRPIDRPNVGKFGGLRDTPTVGRLQTRSPPTTSPPVVTTKPISKQRKMRKGERCDPSRKTVRVHLPSGCRDHLNPSKNYLAVDVHSCGGQCHSASRPVAVPAGEGIIPSFRVKKCKCCKPVRTRMIKKYAMCKRSGGGYTRKTYTFKTADSCACQRCQ